MTLFLAKKRGLDPRRITRDSGWSPGGAESVVGREGLAGTQGFEQRRGEMQAHREQCNERPLKQSGFDQLGVGSNRLAHSSQPPAIAPQPCSKF